MGDRALVIFVSKDRSEVSPVVYSHWQGESIPQFIEDLKVYMGERKDDVQYATARFIGLLHASVDDSPLGLGVWNTPDNIKEAAKNLELISSINTLEEYSHGDAGVIIVKAFDFSWRAFGGYLKDVANDDGGKAA